jgi:ankyrin repeat protein
VPLVYALLDFDAAINGVQDDGSPLLTALAFQYPDAARALETRGARVDTILAAAGLGREELVTQLVDATGCLKPDVPLPPAPKLRLPQDPKAHLARALIWAAALGRTRVVEFLARQRVDLAATDEQGFTALHWAAFRGHLDVMEVLLTRGAPLEAVNAYGGTVLGATEWAATHVDGVFQDGGFERVDYVPVVDRLLAAGARATAS